MIALLVLLLSTLFTCSTLLYTCVCSNFVCFTLLFTFVCYCFVYSLIGSFALTFIYSHLICFNFYLFFSLTLVSFACSFTLPFIYSYFLVLRFYLFLFALFCLFYSFIITSETISLWFFWKTVLYFVTNVLKIQLCDRSKINCFLL